MGGRDSIKTCWCASTDTPGLVGEVTVTGCGFEMH